MSSQTLRPYQSECVQAVMDAYEQGYRRVLYTLPTGCGKTTTFSELVKQFLANDWKVLVLAHRSELIGQAYERIKDHNDLTIFEIGMEIADTHAPRCASVVVGSIMTVKNAARLDWFDPDVIIIDECHRGAGNSFKIVADRAGVNKGECFYVGCTATARRTDKQSLFAFRPDGTRVTLADKRNRKFEADPADCVFEKHVYEYPLTDALEDGWLVPVIGHTVETSTDLSEVRTTAGDYVEGQLAKAVDNSIRTNVAINAWKQIAADRQTLVFCASVEHAHHAAEMWEGAGYTAKAIDGTTDSAVRFNTLLDFKQGRLQILCNCGVFTEGTDLPMCSSVVHLRPTKSWNLYVQMTGRGCRTLPGVVNDTMTAAERRAAIASSAKPDCVVLDLVDISKDQDLCAAPSLLDLPANMDLQGQSITAAKKMLDEFEEVRDQVIGECPGTYQELAVRLSQVSLLRESGARTKSDWAATHDGFRFRRARPGYQVAMTMPEAGIWQLEVKKGTQEILSRRGKQGKEFPAYLDSAARHASEAIERHAEANMPSRGTLTRLTPKQVNVLKANGHSVVEIDAMPYQKAKAMISTYMDAWKARQIPQDEAA